MNLAIVGRGMMGSLVEAMACVHPAIERVVTIEPAETPGFAGLGEPDVLIDFSHPDALTDICAYIKKRDCKNKILQSLLVILYFLRKIVLYQHRALLALPVQHFQQLFFCMLTR